MNTYFVKLCFLVTASLLAITYSSEITCKSEKQKKDNVKQENKSDAVDADTWEDIFTQMHENFAKMQQRMEEDLKSATSRISSSFEKTPMPSLSITSDDKLLVIKLDGATGENSEATTHDNERLTIKTPEVTLELAVHDNVLHAQLTQEQKKEENNSDTKQQFASFSHAETYQTITHELDLDNAKIQSDEKTKTLTITIPFMPEKAGKKLAIEKINAQQPEKEKSAREPETIK